MRSRYPFEASLRPSCQRLQRRSGWGWFKSPPARTSCSLMADPSVRTSSRPVLGRHGTSWLIEEAVARLQCDSSIELIVRPCFRPWRRFLAPKVKPLRQSGESMFSVVVRAHRGRIAEGSAGHGCCTPHGPPPAYDHGIGSPDPPINSAVRFREKSSGSISGARLPGGRWLMSAMASWSNWVNGKDGGEPIKEGCLAT